MRIVAGNRRQSVDETDSDVIAIDAVALPCALAVRPRHRSRCRAVGIEQRGGKYGRVGKLAAATFNR
jgi:hypothetical protein